VQFDTFCQTQLPISLVSQHSIALLKTLVHTLIINILPILSINSRVSKHSTSLNFSVSSLGLAPWGANMFGVSSLMGLPPAPSDTHCKNTEQPTLTASGQVT